MNPGDRVRILSGTYAGKLATVKHAGQYVQIDGQTTLRPYRESSLELVAAPTPTPAPTIPAGQTVRPGDSVDAFLDDIADGTTGYFRGGDYTDPTVTLTKRGVTLKAYPGEKPVWKGGQFRVYGEANTIDGLAFPFENTVGSSKDLEISGADHKLLRCYLSNDYGVIKVMVGGGAGDAIRLLVEDCWFDRIGDLNESNIFKHALYMGTARDCIIRNNRVSNVRGGYFVHGYTSMVNTLVENNRIWNSYAFISAGANSTGSIMRNNAVQWDLGPARKAPCARATNGLPVTVEHNVLWAPGSGYGDDGIEESSNLTARDNLVRSPRFSDPARGDFTVVDAEARAFLGWAS